MSDFSKLPQDIAKCMKRAGAPLSEDQRMMLAGYLAPIQLRLEELEELEAENAELREKYSELMYQVATKHPGESCHETALRYIRQAEAPSDNPPQQADDEGEA